MTDENRLNPGHRQTRAFLRLLGPLLAGAGLLLIAIGMISFFSAFGSFGPPRYFWCAFVGMPLLALGVAISKFAFLGAVMRYTAGEVAPVGKDTFNYLADGTQRGVETMTSAAARGISRGLSEGLSGEPAALPCPACSHANDPDARFCSQCGSPLATTKSCPACSQENDPQARYCDNCGQGL